MLSMLHRQLLQTIKRLENLNTLRVCVKNRVHNLGEINEDEVYEDTEDELDQSAFRSLRNELFTNT